MNDGDYAGISSFQNRYGFAGVKKAGGKTYIVVHCAREKDDAAGTEIEAVATDASRIWLRTECDFRDMADKASFFYSLDGKEWHRIGDTLEMKFDWPDFVGQRFALFYFSTLTPGGHADFDYFRTRPDITID